MMITYRRTPALVAAELDAYTPSYGSSVRTLDQSLGAAPGTDDLIDLTHGDTRAFLPPASASADINAAIMENKEAYSPYRGSANVRRLLAPRAAGLLGRTIDPASELILTPGSQGGLFCALSATVSPGDVIAFPSKEYFMDERISAFLGAEAHRIPMHQDPFGIITIDRADLELASQRRAHVLVLSHPNNPTGGVYSRESAELLARWVVEHDMLAIVDQLYCRLVFDNNEYVHLGALPGMAERTVTLIGPSKTESMSGYRVGAAVGPSEIVDAMEQVISLASLRAAGYAQHTLRHWMDGDQVWLAERTNAHQEIRDFLVDRLRAIPGVTVSAPAGSSYVFPDISDTVWASQSGSDDDHVLAVALKANGVLISPGYQFGFDGRGHFRINFSQDHGRLALACDRIAQVLTRK
jgi:aspartate/methionine/tyrosine aminotransferase